MSEKIARPIIRFLPPDPSKGPPDLLHPRQTLAKDWGMPLKTFLGGLKGEFTTTDRVQTWFPNHPFYIIDTSEPVEAHVLFCAECRVDTRGAQLSMAVTASNYTVMAYGPRIVTSSLTYEVRTFTNAIALKAGTCEFGMSWSVNKGTGYIRDPSITVWLVSMP